MGAKQKESNKVKRNKIGIKELYSLAKDHYCVGVMDEDGNIDPDMEEINLKEIESFKNSCKFIQNLEELFGKIVSISLYPEDFFGISLLSDGGNGELGGIGELNVLPKGYVHIDGCNIHINYLTDNYSKYQNGAYKMFIVIKDKHNKEHYVEC